MNKKLVLDISNQKKTPSIVILADASNYYDRIAHLLTAITCQHFGLQIEYLLMLFGTIQIMKMFMKTSFKVSEKYYTETQLQQFQGAIQGNGAVSLI